MLQEQGQKFSNDWWLRNAEMSFYLGRLTVRDSRTHWRTVILGRLAELHGQSFTIEAHQRCMDFYDSYLAHIE